MASDSITSKSPSPSSSDEEEEEEENQPTNENPNTNSIDTSLDAIETQLSSISFIPPPIDHHPTDQPPPSAADHNPTYEQQQQEERLVPKIIDVPDGLIAEMGAEKERILSGESGSSSGMELWGDGNQVEGGYNDSNEEKSVLEVKDGAAREVRETGGEKRRDLTAESSSLDYNEENYVSEIEDGAAKETGGEKQRNSIPESSSLDYNEEKAVSAIYDGAVRETSGGKPTNLVGEISSLGLGRNDKQVVAGYDDEEAVSGINNGAVRETDGEKRRNLDLGMNNNQVEDDYNEEKYVAGIDDGAVREMVGEKGRNLIGESSSLDMWRNNNVEVEVEVEGGLSSPSSSGYAGERGSSGSVTSGSGTDGGIREVGREDNGSSVGDGGVVALDSSEAQWSRGKRHADEDDTSISWRKRKKHFFVLSHSGKPIYSRYGDEHKLAGFSATLQAIISFVEDGGDRVKLVRAGKHQVVFLVKGPIYLVCISCTEEPHESLRGQLELLYGQMILILTRSVDRCFEKNSKFDMTPLLGGTDAIFSSLIHSFGQNPATFLHAYTCLPLAYATRQAAGAILQDVADTGVVFAILMCKDKVVSLVGLQKSSLHPDDMLLLANFVTSSESFRTSESFSPICLPRYNAMAFLYAYVHYFDADTYLILLTASSQAFFHLKECRIQIETVLSKSNVLNEVQRSISDGGLRVDQLPVDPSARSGSLFHSNQRRPPETAVGVGGPAGLLHFIYRSIYLDQYVSSEFASPISSPPQQKRLYRAYQRLYASMHDKGIGPHKTQFRRDENYVLLCWVTQDFELYAAFDPLADKAVAIRICNRVCQWVKDVENEIFLLGASPFSW